MQNLSSPHHSQNNDSKETGNHLILLSSTHKSNQNTPGMNVDEEYFSHSHEPQMHEEKMVHQVEPFVEETTQQAADPTRIREHSNAISDNSLESNSDPLLSTFDGEASRIANQNTCSHEEFTKPINFEESPQPNSFCRNSSINLHENNNLQHCALSSINKSIEASRTLHDNQPDESFIFGEETDDNVGLQNKVGNSSNIKNNCNVLQSGLVGEESQGTASRRWLENDDTEKEVRSIISPQKRIPVSNQKSQANEDPEKLCTQRHIEPIPRNLLESGDFCEEKGEKVYEIQKNPPQTSEIIEAQSADCQITKSPMRSKCVLPTIALENSIHEETAGNQSRSLEESEIPRETSTFIGETELAQFTNQEQEKIGETEAEDEKLQIPLKDPINSEKCHSNSELIQQLKTAERKNAGQPENKTFPKKVLRPAAVMGAATITDVRRPNLTKNPEKQKFGENIKPNIPIKINNRKTEKIQATSKLIPNLKNDDEEDKKLLCEVFAETRLLQSALAKKRGRDQIAKSPDRDLADKKAENLFNKKVKLTEAGKENQLKESKIDLKPSDSKRNKDLKEPNSNTTDNTFFEILKNDGSRKENAGIKPPVHSKTPPRRPSCGLCGGELKASQNSILACLHKFHTECFNKYNKKKIECPICNGTLKALQSNNNPSNVMPITKKNLLA